MNEIDEICTALKNGIHVVVFPEATSTNGERVLNFKSPLYSSAISATSVIQPLCLNYISIDETPLSRKNRDHIFWYGDMDFFPHLKQLMKFKKVKVRLEFINTIDTFETENEISMGLNVDSQIVTHLTTDQYKILARHLADKTHSYISERFQPCL
jgi:1-acyl-sn-glycerol-3-phosphate acyltransferase